MYVFQPDGSDRILWRFNGGLHIPHHKALSNNGLIRPTIMPQRLVLPLQQHIGAVAKSTVKPGDYVLKGELIATVSDGLGASVHAPTSGKILEVGLHPVPHPSGLAATCITIIPDGADTWTELPAPMLDYATRSPVELIERINWAGIVGLGGATFPTSAKLTQALGKQVTTLIINGIECEPYITCDDMLMRTRSAQIVDGVRILLHILGVTQCLIGIEDNKPEAITTLYKAIQTPDVLDRVQVVRVPTLYPSGGERQLIRLLTGYEVPSGGLPADVGVVCLNVGTVAAIAAAVLLGQPLISRVVTITGQGVQDPGNMDVLLGTSLADLVQQAGGYTATARRLIIGGPMMGFAVPNPALPVTKATNCLLVASQAEVPEPVPARPCIRCGECARVCPANLLPQQLYWHSRAKNLEQAQAYHLFDCIECGCCSYICPSYIPLVQYYRATKAALREQATERLKASQAKLRYDARKARLQRLEELRQARLRQRQTALNNEDGAAIEAALRRVAAKKQVELQDG